MDITSTPQPAIPPLTPLWQDLLDRLEQSQGTGPATVPSIDFRAFLAALQDTAHQSAQTAKESAKEVTRPVQPNAPPSYPPLATETRATLPTPEAAFHLSRAQQTMRLWAMKGEGPLRPLRINGRLAWKVSDLKRVLGVA
jgi:hypothetical protein